MSRMQADRWRRRLADERGAAMTEYVVLVGFVGFAFMFALLTVGPMLIQNFESTRTLLAAPFP